MGGEHCEYRHQRVRDAAEACRIANREMWDLVSVVSDSAGVEGGYDCPVGSPRQHLIAFYRIPL